MEKQRAPGYFGEWLQQRRKTLDLTQAELAQRAGCSVFALRKIESGERRPSKQLAGLLSTALGIPAQETKTFIRVARGELNLERLAAAGAVPPVLPNIPQKTSAVHLPLQSTLLVGREPELAALHKTFLMPDCRLLTLIGMGGIGKTRLAVELAANQRTAFPGGVYYVPLASLNSAELIVPAIAEVVGYIFSGPSEPREQLLAYLAGAAQRPLLLILDNFEHLLVPFSQEIPQSGATDLVSTILERVPNLKILVTSRERLNLRGEWIFELPGLPVPPPVAGENIEAYGAAALFIQSARRIRADFAVKEEQHSLRRICAMLEGIPLAIELAAVWVGVLSCREIAEEIQSNLDFLSTSMRDMPERHRSMRATFDHSWKLLSDEERGVLAKLSVFHGGFQREAAEQIARASLALLGSLLSKSLISRTQAGRYDLHEVIRQYALLHLESGPAAEETHLRHSEYYLALAREHERALKSGRQQEAHRQISDEIENVRQAWNWCIEHDRLAFPGEAVRALTWYFEVGGLLHEGIELIGSLAQALRAKGADPSMRKFLGQALAQQSLLFFRKGEFGRAQGNLEESLAILRPFHDPRALVDPLIYLGIILHLNGELDRSQSLLEEGLAYTQAEEDEWFRAFFLANLGYVAGLRNCHQEAYEQMQAALKIWRRLGDPHSIGMGINFMSPTLIKLGYYAEAESALQESISLAVQSGNRWGMGTAYRFLGLVKLAEGQYAEAQAHLRKSLDVFGDFFVGWDIARTLTYLGETALKMGDVDQGRKTYLIALGTALEAGAMPIATDAMLGLAEILLQSGEAGNAFKLALHVMQNGAAVEETRAAATRLAVVAESHLQESEIRGLTESVNGLSLQELAEGMFPAA